MKVTVLEVAAGWGHAEEKLDQVEAALKAHPPGDLVLLGEAVLTGYLPAPTSLAQPRGGLTERRLEQLSRMFSTVVVGPLIERDGERVFNAMVAPRHFHYRKRHPWYVEGWATPGEAPPPVVSIAGKRVTIAICFDIHFLSEVNADVLLFPSAWVDDGDDARDTLLPEVARRFRVDVVNANWGAGVPRIEGQGGSRVVSRSGDVLARCVPPAHRLDVELG